MTTNIELRIKRQDGPGQPPRWETFSLPYRAGLNVISCLQDIQKKPATIDGKNVSPVIWECNCLEEVCGACTMLINGRVRQACSALIDDLEKPISLEPLSKFPIVRDLMVDRSAMFEALKKIRGWAPIDGTYDLGEGPRRNPDEVLEAYKLSQCMTCGCCMEACPQYNENSDFIGPAPLGQVDYFNRNPIAAVEKSQRLRAVMGPGGVADCGKAQNCVRVCPKEIPLTTSIAIVFRDTTLEGILGFLKK
jgi:succinate dehydrogenase / fumarate reductase iron-sulfur subunit